MSKLVLIDAFQVVLIVPANLNATEAALIRRTLNNRSFTQRLRRAVASVCRDYPSLSAVSVRISQ